MIVLARNYLPSLSCSSIANNCSICSILSKNPHGKRSERSVPTENCKKERENSSSSSYDGDLSEQDDAPLLGEENMVINKASQVKAKVKSRKSQAVLEECLKCAERKLKIRETGDYALKREKWLAVARRMKELVLCSGIKIFNIPGH